MSKPTKPTKIKTPRWRIVLRFMIPIFFLIAIISGMIVGYVVLGKRSIDEVFHWGTWKHVFDLVFAPS
ncbi:DNA-directed RNA polymerase subunit beta [compost metagenome]